MKQEKALETPRMLSLCVSLCANQMKCSAAYVCAGKGKTSDQGRHTLVIEEMKTEADNIGLLNLANLFCQQHGDSTFFLNRILL